MTKQEFLTQLKKQLHKLPQAEQTEILYDYEEHFQMGIEAGKSEAEIAYTLGDPVKLARQYRFNYAIDKAEQRYSAANIFKAVLASAGLGFFNLIFILGPYLGLLGVLLGLFAASISLILAGIAGVGAVFIAPLFDTIHIGINPVSALFISSGIGCLGALFLIANCYLANYFYKGTIKYLKWNLEIIKK